MWHSNLRWVQLPDDNRPDRVTIDGSRPFRDYPRSIISIVIRGRSRECPEWRGYNRRGGANDSARRTERPEQRKRRTRRIVLSVGGGNRHRGEPGSKRRRDCHLADGHGVSWIGVRASVPACEARKTY